MNLEEFEDFLGDIGESIGSLDDAIQNYLTLEVTRIQAQAPVDNGDLRRSIKLTGDQFGFQIQMNYYGVFQNYGVIGTKSTKLPVLKPEPGLSIAGIPIPEKRFSFKEASNAWGVKYTGIRGRSFFSVADIFDGLLRTIEQNLDLE